MSDNIEVKGDTTSYLKRLAFITQGMNEEFEELSRDCENANGHGGCLINIADGCLILSCPLAKEE